jgi:hypothetical protein
VHPARATRLVVLAPIAACARGPRHEHRARHGRRATLHVRSDVPSLHRMPVRYE